MDPATALRTLLDHVDYTSGACRMNEPIGGVLPREVIALCRNALTAQPPADTTKGALYRV